MQLLLVALDRLTAVAYAEEQLSDRDVGTPVATVRGSHGDGEAFGLTLHRGTTRDYVAIEGEPFLREVSDEVFQVIGGLELPPALPDPG